MIRRSRLLVVAATVGAAVAVTATASSATTDDQTTREGQVSFFNEQLSGFNEVPLALSTPATAQFRAVINDRAQEISYRLSYADFPTAVTQSHVHFGSPAQSGGVSFFLCSNLGNGPAGTQACPAAPATITGTIKPADVIGPTGQGIAPGEFAEIVKAIRAGATYVNIHTVAFPAGEGRSQLGHQH
jgi:CHRD domain-containing protein